MTQPEALRLVDWCDANSSGIYRPSAEAAAELRRLHAENQDLRTRHYCNTAEIESLRARVQELDEMAQENRSKRMIELESRVQELEAEAEINYVPLSIETIAEIAESFEATDPTDSFWVELCRAFESAMRCEMETQLLARIDDLESEAEQNAKIIGASAETELA